MRCVVLMSASSGGHLKTTQAACGPEWGTWGDSCCKTGSSFLCTTHPNGRTIKHDLPKTPSTTSVRRMVTTPKKTLLHNAA